MNIIGKLAAVLCAFLLFFFLPLSFYARQLDGLSQIFVQMEAEKFVCEVETKGAVKKEDYLSFLERLEDAGGRYAVTMAHSHMITGENSETDEYGEYALNYYDEEIRTEVLKNNGEYRMAYGDYFSIKIINQSETFSDFFDKMVYGRNVRSHAVYATAGGKIRNEVF